MTKQSAINYLKYLHKLEEDLRKDLFGLEQSKLVEDIRLKFLKNYQDKKGR